jgi:hypothetical protein
LRQQPATIVGGFFYAWKGYQQGSYD